MRRLTAKALNQENIAKQKWANHRDKLSDAENTKDDKYPISLRNHYIVKCADRQVMPPTIYFMLIMG
jgi:hypothetical protein